jgi:hypothetical protein
LKAVLLGVWHFEGLSEPHVHSAVVLQPEHISVPFFSRPGVA